MPETAVFDHYEVLTRDDGSLFELGRGAMGITYKAFDVSLKFPVALKVINATYLHSDIARQRFIREARAAAQLRHRNVASVFHLGTDGDTWFYAMEFIDGETLEALIKKRGPLNSVLALKIAGQVARALNAAAEHGLVHRDIKPANLMLVKEDEELVAKVIDFGLAKPASDVDGEDSASLSAGGFVGTFLFASPEQLEERDIDIRSDIYSLGVTFWYMLAGKPPFAGSIARVSSQHLTKQPPFEMLPHVPAPVTAVLRKMLSKTPEDRYQTPLELRKAVEGALAEITASHSGTTLNTEAAQELNFLDTYLEDSTDSTDNFATNTIIANRYRVRQFCGETNAGRVFRATDIDRKIDVRLLVLHPETADDSVALAALEREIDKLVQVRHPNLLGVYGFETVDRGSFLVLEWTHGFSLLDLLKKRHALGAGEAFRLLEQAAAGADEALRLGLHNLEFGLHQLHIHFPRAFDRERLLHAPLESWPEFELKLYPLGTAVDFASSQSRAAEHTMVGSSASKSSGGAAEVRTQYVQALGAVVYQILGGRLSPLALLGAGDRSRRFAPLAALSEEGNEVLRRALDPAQSFPSAGEFSSALAGLSGSKAPLPKPPSHDDSLETQVDFRRFEPGPPRTIPIALIGALAVAVVVGVAFGIRSHFKGSGKATPKPSSIATLTQPESTGKPAIRPPTPNLGPTQDLITAVAKADEFESQGNWPKALDALLRIVKDYPQSPVGKNHLETLLNHLRDRPSPISFDEFQKIRVEITKAAQLDTLSAMLLLGDNLRPHEPKMAAYWFSHAAAKNDPVGLVQYGLMLKKGEGVEQADPEKAATLFQKAANRNDINGKIELAVCYLRKGQGVIPDQKHAAELFQEAADRGDSRAMDELGNCYVHGFGVPRDYDKAFQLFSDAVERGNLEATGNLGVLYLQGRGVVKSERKGAELFKKGADLGNSYCMYLYGRALLEGVGVAQDDSAAFHFLSLAAEKGNLNAMGELGLMYLEDRRMDVKPSRKRAPASREPAIEVNPQKAAELFRKGAQGGNPYCMDLYGWALENGVGTEKDLNAAFQYYSKATETEGGYVKAYRHLGLLYSTGQGITQDFPKAAELFEKGATAGDPGAMLLYAQALEKGEGVSPDKTLAANWYRKAAAAGDQDATRWCIQHHLAYEAAN